MNEALVQNWNNVVGPKDRVIIVGDFAWKNHTHWIGRLRGKKILIQGNHDHMSQVALAQFTEVYQYWDTKINGQRVSLFHYPCISWSASNHGSWHFYGHCHGRLKEPTTKLCCDVGVDVWNYAPVNWEVLAAKMKAKMAHWSGNISEDGSKHAAEELTRNRQHNLTLVKDGK
jgi:calcineurin-like phosphoesterase family protein